MKEFTLTDEGIPACSDKLSISSCEASGNRDTGISLSSALSCIQVTFTSPTCRVFSPSSVFISFTSGFSATCFLFPPEQPAHRNVHSVSPNRLRSSNLFILIRFKNGNSSPPEDDYKVRISLQKASFSIRFFHREDPKGLSPPCLRKAKSRQIPAQALSLLHRPVR